MGFVYGLRTLWWSGVVVAIFGRIVWAQGEKWKKHRRMLTPTFHFSILEKYIDVFSAASDVLVEQFRKEVGKTGFNAYKYINLCALDIICESAMGVCVNAQTQESKYLTAVKAMCQIVVKRALSTVSKYPIVYCFTKMCYDEKRYLKTLHGYTYAIIHKRRQELSENLERIGQVSTDREDNYGQRKKMVFLDLLLQANIDGTPLTDEEIREEVDTFMFEGHDTVTSAISFAIHCLSSHPDCQAKVLDEQRAIFGDDRRRNVTYKDLQQMHYLEMFIKETLRLYPSVPTYYRAITERIQHENMTLEPGITLMVFVFALHRNPDYFPNPLRFDPERFNTANNSGKFPYSYVPFSAGPRNCIDQNFYYTAPSASYIPSTYQHDYANQQPNRETSPGFQQLESYFPTHRDLQTSDLPVHLQQTLPQYRLSSAINPPPKATFHQHFPGTGAHPAPFRPVTFAQELTPSTHRPNYSRVLNKNHHTNDDDAETFLGQITIESPAELPAQFNFKPSVDFPHTVAKRPNPNLDDSARNTVSLGFLNHRTRIFAPTQDVKNKPHVKNYFVSVNGDVYAPGSTTPYSITTLIRKDRYDPLLYKPASGNYEKSNVTTIDLESLLEEPIDESKRDKQSDRVEVIKSVTVPPDRFYTASSSDETTETPEYDYESTEDVTDKLMNELEMHEDENNVSNNTLKYDKGYDVLTMKPSTMVQDDNFKEFVDSTVIDNTSDEPNTTTTLSDIISVVTTKSVINSTLIGAVTTPKTIQHQLTTPITSTDNSSESWIVVASVQTSRSVSGARYLPSAIVEQEQRTKLLLNEQSAEDTTDTRGKSKTSTESLIDKLDRVQSDLSSGLLSDGFKPSGVINIAVLTDVQETTVFDSDITTTLAPLVIKQSTPNTRSTVKPKLFKTRTKSDTFTKPLSDLSKYLPVGYTLPPNLNETQPKTIADILRVKPIDDLMVNVSGGFKSPEVTTVAPSASTTRKLTVKIAKKDDISAFLPPGYKLAAKEEQITKARNKTIAVVKQDDVSAFLPHGYKGFKKPIAHSSADSKMTNKTKVDTLLAGAEPADISKYLPAGYKPRSTTTRKPTVKTVVNTATEVTITSTKASFKVVFPSRPGARKSTSSRLTTPKYSAEDSNGSEKNSTALPSPTIQKGWPSRATTEFTGWPTQSTTPFSIEKLLQKAREEAAAAAAASSSTEDTSLPATTVSSTTTSTSTTTKQPTTTPGLCRGECDLAGTIKLVGGAKWVPELLDRNTKEWQILANEVQSQLEDVYSKSSVLNKWYKRIRIDGFTEGSVLVDYLVELNDFGAQVDTLTIKRLFHESLLDNAKTASNREAKASVQRNDTNKWAPRLSLGNFIVDPTFTDFIVIPKQQQPTVGYADENVLLPQWAIAVIVIGLASLLFVIIFGVTVLVNRQKSAKKKQPTPLTDDMLHELNKNHMGGGVDNYATDDLYNMEDVWNDRQPYDTKIPKKQRSIRGDNSMANLYDSWKSEWNGYYYNTYYGQPSASGAITYNNQYNGRRRSDYDTNF